MGGRDGLLGSSGSLSDDASSEEGVRGQPMSGDSEELGSDGPGSHSAGGSDRGIDSDGVDLEAEYEAQLAAEQGAGDESPSEAELDDATLAALQTLRGKRWADIHMLILSCRQTLTCCRGTSSCGGQHR
jgi:hypothetical protein